MKINDLRLFQSICETGSYTRTGEIFFLSQPAITAAVNRLENDLGTKLFLRDRFRPKITLTHTGELFRKHADRILNELRQANMEIRTYENTRTIRFGLPPMIGAYYFSLIVPELNAADLLSSMQIMEYGSERMLKELLLGHIDLGIIGSQDSNFMHKGIESTQLSVYPFGILVSASDPLIKKGYVTFEQIKERKFISMKSDYIHHSVLTKLFEQHGAIPHIVIETDYVQTLKSLVSANAGIALLSEMVLVDHSDSVAFLRLDDQFLPGFYLYLCYQKEKFLMKAEKEIIRIIRKRHEIAENTEKA